MTSWLVTSCLCQLLEIGGTFLTEQDCTVFAAHASYPYYVGSFIAPIIMTNRAAGITAFFTELCRVAVPCKSQLVRGSHITQCFQLTANLSFASCITFHSFPYFWLKLHA